MESKFGKMYMNIAFPFMTINAIAEVYMYGFDVMFGFSYAIRCLLSGLLWPLWVIYLIYLVL